ncbi:YdcF family protein [Vibrio sp. SS-MA-C1-2]|uniref:SanA/YdcF family protein n=1 Tax=Vibrio sp. SS-MA-C1-2 TaxID=2908646 RepID=UPI001F39C2AA|nr:ElyC/SanA/YdcF family protein [Vibrio sp. SS-MA-C1-2]UJF19968.1 YdcF family protein [Vibrio sp. SS-MA-C1-2]
MIIKKLALSITVLFITAFLTLLAIDRAFSWQSSEKIYTDINTLPSRPVALILGTSKYVKGGNINAYYYYRVKTATDLYKEKKVNYLLLSGDNAHRSYNEPWTMKRDLLKAGIPEQAIYLDYAGFRTLDSIVRAKLVFQSNNFIIVTQRFHCERALFIAKHRDIDAICLAVPGPQGSSGLKVRIREVFARIKAILDIYILNQQPKFLGPSEPIGQQPQ